MTVDGLVDLDPPDIGRPLAALVGTWRGDGVGSVPDGPDFAYGQEIVFRPVPGLDVLEYRSRTWWPHDGAPIEDEAGYWRVTGDRTVEVMLARTNGIVEVYVGDLTGDPGSPRIDLHDNATVRTANAPGEHRSTRLYGFIGDDLAYAVDTAHGDAAPRPRMACRLVRVGD